MSYTQLHLGDLFRSRREPGKTGLPVMSVTINDGLVHRDTLDRKTNGELEAAEHLLIRKGDIAYNMMRMWQGASGLAEKDGIVSPAYVVVAPKEGIDPLFASYWFKSARMIYLFWAFSYGITGDRLRLYYKDFAKIPVSVPPKPEQERIGRVLVTMDRTIMKLEKLIAAKRKFKKGLAQRLLTGQRRLPGFNENWEKNRLGELFIERNETGYADLHLLSVTRHMGVVPHGEANSKDSSSEDKSNYKRILPGDIGYNTMRMWQGISAHSSIEGIISPAYTVCTPLPRIDVSFATQLFKFPPVIYLFYRYSQGLVSDTWNLKFRHFAQITVEVPPLCEQIHISAVLGAADREIALLEKKLTALRELKKGLMQKLLTGSANIKA